MTSFRLSLTLLCSTRYSELSRKRTVSVVSIVVVIRCFGYSHSRGVYIFIFVLFTFFSSIFGHFRWKSVARQSTYLSLFISWYLSIPCLIFFCRAASPSILVCRSLDVVIILLYFVWCCCHSFLFFSCDIFSLFILIIGLFSLELIHSRQEIKSVKMWLHGIQTVRASFTKRLNHKSVCGVTHTHTWAWTQTQTLSLQCLRLCKLLGQGIVVVIMVSFEAIQNNNRKPKSSCNNNTEAAEAIERIYTMWMH